MRTLQARIRCLTIYRQISIGVGLVLVIGALTGTLLTRFLVLRNTSGWVLVLVVGAGVGLSVWLACALARAALRPLRELHRLLLAAGEQHSGIDLRQLASYDPEIRGLAKSANAIIQQLQESVHQQRALSQHAIAAQEEERKRIARTLHDDTGQALSTLIFNLERLEGQLPPEQGQLRARLTETRAFAAVSLNDLRQTIAGLRPAILDDLGLVPAIRWYARTHLEAAGIQFELSAPEAPLELAPHLSTTLFRIAQEGVNNIIRHSGARTARIELRASATEIVLQIEDDGRGFNVRPEPGAALQQAHWGLLGIRERIELVNGQAAILSDPGAGTIIQVSAPAEWQAEQEGVPPNG